MGCPGCLSLASRKRLTGESEIVSNQLSSIRPRIKNRDYTETSPHTEKALGWLAATGKKKIGQEFPEKEIETKREGSS
jgi:hypothetical protein